MTLFSCIGIHRALTSQEYDQTLNFDAQHLQRTRNPGQTGMHSERLSERPAPIRLPPARANSTINLISDDLLSPDSRPRMTTLSPTMRSHKSVQDAKEGWQPESEQERRSVAAPSHRLQTPWPKKENNRPLRTEATDMKRSASPTAESLVPRALTDIPSIEPSPPQEMQAALDQNEVRRVSDSQVEAIKRKQLAVATSISCAYCTATGVNSTWRRDKAGKPLCGRCCEQLRRRMNPRQVSCRLPDSKTQGPLTPMMQTQAAIPRPAPIERPAQRAVQPRVSARTPSPPPQRRVQMIRQTNGHTAGHPYQRPAAYDSNDLRRGSNGSNVRGYRAAPPSSAHVEGARRDSYAGYNDPRVALPPLSTIERMADNYAPPQTSPTRRFARQYDRPSAPSEADVRERRAMLMEGRRWILDMLDDTTAMLRELDNATPGPSMVHAKYGAGQVH